MTELERYCLWNSWFGFFNISYYSVVITSAIVITYSVVITIILWKGGSGFSYTGTLECLDIFKLHKICSNITVKNVSFIKKLQPTAGEVYLGPHNI